MEFFSQCLLIFRLYINKSHELPNSSNPFFTTFSLSPHILRLEREISPKSLSLSPAMVVAMDQRSNVNGGDSGVGGLKGERFDPSAQPPFKIGDIRAAIPKHCWVKSPLRSMSYVFRDIFAVAAMAIAAVYLDSWIFWPLYWAAQGTLFWAIFVLGHDWYIFQFRFF